MNRAFFLSLCLLVACCKPQQNPPASDLPPTGVARFIVGGDSRDDIRHVLPWAFQQAVAHRAAAFLFLGDMELTPALDPVFDRELPLLGDMPFYPALGNHEVKVFGSIAIGEREAEARFKRRFLGTARTPVRSVMADRVVYSVDLPGNVHFVALDNVTAEDFGAPQLGWLEIDLAQAQTEGKIVLVGMHRPLAGNGVTTHCMAANSDSDRALAIFQAHRVRFILASHEHLLAHFTQGGIESYITGGLGAPLATGTAGSYHHFVQLDVSAAGIVATVVRFPGTPVLATRNAEGLDD